MSENENDAVEVHTVSGLRGLAQFLVRNLPLEDQDTLMAKYDEYTKDEVEDV